MPTQSQGYVVRLAVQEDLSFLPELEKVAGLRFKPYSADLSLTEEMYDDVTPMATFEEAQRNEHLWVVAAPTRDIAGFALVTIVGDYVHLHELDVLPSHSRQGFGTALLSTVCAWARDARYRGVTLRTFRDVPWNAPFYARHGFRVVNASVLSPAHRELEADEHDHGLRAELRVTMLYDTARE